MVNIDSLNRILSRINFCNPFQRICKMLLVGFLCLTMMLLSPPAYADSAGMETGRSLSDSADIAADKVDQFAQAYLQVLQLLSDREPELPAAETNAEALKIEQSIEAEAIDLIESNGLTLPEYMQVLGLASQDATFRDKVLGRMDESLEG